MRSIIIAVISCVVVTASICVGGSLLRDDNGAPVQDFVTTYISSTTQTKAQKVVTIPVGAFRAKLRASSAVNVFLNATTANTGWPLKSASATYNSDEVIGWKSNVTKLVFTGASSAAKTINIQWQQ